MKLLKKILIGLAIVIALPFIAALFIKKEYAVEREITINQPKAHVFNYIKYLKNQDSYSKWAQLDPNMKKQFTGTDGTAGFTYAWDGNSDAGKGEQEIKNIVEGEKVDIAIRFIEPIESNALAPMTTEAVSPTQTKVKWGIQGRNSYPFNVMNLFMDNMIGEDLEVGLANLKTVLEKQ